MYPEVSLSNEIHLPHNLEYMNVCFHYPCVEGLQILLVIE